MIPPRRLPALLLAALAACGSESAPPPRTAPPPAASARPRVDVSKWENEGKEKCGRGLALVRQRLDTKNATDPEIIRFDLEAAFAQLTEGLAAYETAAKKSGRTYDLAEYRGARTRAMTALCDSIEGDAKKSCERGLGLIRKCESLMTGRALNDEERGRLRRDLEAGKDLIEEGMGLFERSNELSGHTFDTTRYGQAMKAASMKLLELKK